MRCTLLIAVLLVGLGNAPGAGAQAVWVDRPAVVLTALGGPIFDTSSVLSWQGVQGTRTKITVETWTFNQVYGLTVEAQNERRGRAAGVVDLVSGAPAQDVVTDINPGNWRNKTGDATLRYVATPPAAAPGGVETHIVTYTLTQQ